MNVKIRSYGVGYPLVFFHGWGFDSQIWLPLIPYLSTSYQMILVDLPGFGQSSVMDWESFKRHLLSELPQQFAVLGWSMGGLYATRLALEESIRVSHLVNLSSAPRFLLDDDWPAVSPVLFEQFHQKLLNNPSITLREFTQLHVNRKQFDIVSLGYLPSAEGLTLGLDVLAHWDFRQELKTFEQPVCYMFGRLDPIVPIKMMPVMQSIYPHFKYVFFKRAAHMAFLSHMDLFVEEVKEFIQ